MTREVRHLHRAPKGPLIPQRTLRGGVAGVGGPDDLALDVGQWDYRTTEGSEKVLLRGGVASGQSWSPTGQPMQGGQRNGSCLSWN